MAKLDGFFYPKGRCDVGSSPRPFLCSGEHQNMARDGGRFDLGFGGVGGRVWWSTGDVMKSGGGRVILPCTTSGRWSSRRLVAARLGFHRVFCKIRAWELTYL
jgi:hypothetical protein